MENRDTAGFRIARSSQPAELPIELRAAENQRRRPPVRAVVGIIDEMPLLEKAVHLLRREPLTRFDGRLAGNHVQYFIEYIAPRGLFRPLGELFGHVADELFEVGAGQHGGVTGQEDRVSADFVDGESQFGQQFPVLAEQGGCAGLELDGLGDEQLLRFDPPLENPSAKLLVNHPLVQGVLIDDREPLFGLDDQVAIVYLHRTKRRRVRSPRPPVRGVPVQRHAVPIGGVVGKGLPEFCAASGRGFDAVRVRAP